jgi:hypothetical protein
MGACSRWTMRCPVHRIVPLEATHERQQPGTKFIVWCSPSRNNLAKRRGLSLVGESIERGCPSIEVRPIARNIRRTLALFAPERGTS